MPAQAEDVPHPAPLEVAHQLTGDRVIGHSEHLRAVELAEQLLLRRTVLRNRTTHPGGLHEVLEMNVLVVDVAAPDTAPETRIHAHAVGERSRICFRLRLPLHHAPNRMDAREAVDVL